MCPCCQSYDIQTIRTTKKDDSTLRECKCQSCNCIFYTEEEIKQVSIYNHIKRKAFRMPVREYVEKKLWDVRREIA
jgi:transcriptional regulator NrdR family protein